MFVVPGRGTDWMKEPASMASHFEHICFVRVMAGGDYGSGDSAQVWVSLAGIPAIMRDKADFVELGEECKDLAESSESNAEPGSATYVEASEVANVRKFTIISRFSMDTEDIVAQVFVIDAQVDDQASLGENVPMHAQIDESPHVSTQISDDRQTASSSSTGLSAAESDSKATSNAGMATSPHQIMSLPWRETLLKKLREPRAGPIVKEINKIIKILAHDHVTTRAKVDATQDFYQDIRKRLASNPGWANATPVELDGSIDAIEKYIFSKCQAWAYQPTDVDDMDDQLQDKLFFDKCMDLGKVQLGLILGDCALHGEEVPGLSSMLGLLANVHTPIEKLEILVAFVKECAMYSSTIGEGSADALLPTIMRAIIRPSPPHSIISDIKYIQRYHNHARMAGETSYCMTNIVAAITMIEKIWAEQIGRTSDPIYSLVASQDSL